MKVNFFNISEKDFWNAIRIRSGTVKRTHLAYEMLNTHYRLVTTETWKQMKTKAMTQPKPDMQLVDDMFAGRVVVAHNMEFRFKKRVDFTSLASGYDALSWLQGMRWCQPMLTYFLQKNDPKARQYLSRLITALYESRNACSNKKYSNGHYAYGPLGYCPDFMHQLYVGLLHTGNVPASVTEAVMKYVLGAGRAVYRNVKRFIIHNIHTAGCCMLYTASSLFPEFKESVMWRKLAIRHLVSHSKVSFFDDGCHQERCWGYGWHTLNRLTKFYREAIQTTGLDGQEKLFLNNLRHAYRWYAKTSGPGFLCPPYGDDNVFDCAPTLKEGRTLFPFNAGLNLGVDRKKSYFTKSSGFAFMRNNDDDNGIYAYISFGPYAGWHSHFDSLGLNIRMGKTSLLEELGRFGSYGHPLDHIFRSPEAHNQLLVDAHPYDNRFDDGCKDVAWYSDAHADYFSAVHHAYRYASDPEGREHRTYVGAEPLTVRRTVVFIKDPGYFVVMDSVTAEKLDIFNRAISGWWHSPKPFKILTPNSARTTGRDACLLVWLHTEGLRRIETGCDFDDSVESANNKRSYFLRARRWLEQTHVGITGFTTILFPYRDRIPAISVNTLKTQGNVPFRTEGIETLRMDGGKPVRDVILLNPEGLSGFKWHGITQKHRANIHLGDKEKHILIK